MPIYEKNNRAKKANVKSKISPSTFHESNPLSNIPAMNSRAAVELAIASAFYSLGIFTLELFSAVVLMAAVTSITTPILLKLVAKYVTVT